MRNLSRKLSYTLYFVLVAVIFNSCITPISDDFNSLQTPIIVVGVDKENGGVTVCDANNKYLTISGDYILAGTLSEYNIGDTIGCFNCN